MGPSSRHHKARRVQSTKSWNGSGPETWPFNIYWVLLMDWIGLGSLRQDDKNHNRTIGEGPGSQQSTFRDGSPLQHQKISGWMLMASHQNEYHMRTSNTTSKIKAQVQILTCWRSETRWFFFLPLVELVCQAHPLIIALLISHPWGDENGWKKRWRCGFIRLVCMVWLS